METLFRFNILREGARISDDVSSIDLSTDSDFQSGASAIASNDQRPARLKEHAASYIGSSQFIGGVGTDDDLKALDTAADALESLVDLEEFSRAKAQEALENAFGGDVSDFVAKQSVRRKVTRLKDSILAIKLSPKHHHYPIHRLAALLRAEATASMVAEGSDFPADAAALSRALRRGLKVPDAVLPNRPPRPPVRVQPGLTDKLKGYAKRYEALDGAIAELGRLRPRDFATAVQRPSPARLPPSELRPEALFKTENAIRLSSVRNSLLASVADNVAATRPSDNNFDSGLMLTARAGLTIDKVATEMPGFDVRGSTRIALSGHKEFEPAERALSGIRLKKEVGEGLSRETQKTLKESGIDVTEPIINIMQTLQSERTMLNNQVQQEIQPLTTRSVRKIGSTSVAITSAPVVQMYGFTPLKILDEYGDLLDSMTEGVPSTSASIEPAGIIDLLIVKQHLLGYKGGEVSHIENILKGESKSRTHRTRLETEVVTVRETESETTTENSLETTDRFEMKRESEEALEEEVGVKGSASLKAKYGPTVEFKASVEASWSSKSRESQKMATETAREVTQKASEKVTERILMRETRRITREIEDTNIHGFDNKEGEEHVSGVYQWLHKDYEVQIYNYGMREVYDIMIPEPAMLLFEAFRRDSAIAPDIVKPPEWTIRPSQLTPDNYQQFVTLYRATDVAPPPQPYVIESYDFNTGGEDKDQEFTNSTRIRIPDGYQAMHGSVGSVNTVWDDWTVDVVLGTRGHRFQTGSGGWVWPTELDGETGAIPFAMVTDRVGDIALAIEVFCQATDRAMELWQADTHAKLTDAYRARMSEYEAKLAEAEAMAPTQVESRNPANNRKRIIEEIKRAAISVLTRQQFTLFDSVTGGVGGLPGIDFDEAEVEGAYARFFEQAFEWEQLSWVTYPYYWGRRSKWIDRILLEDDDPDFEDFLRAGFARVQIPIRDSFRTAVDHFRLFGDPWFGGSLPAVSDATYLPIADEIAERYGRPGDEEMFGPSWRLEVPTQLVRLRKDDDLPKWERQEDGSYAEVD